MHNENPESGNLFCRLFSYVPRLGDERKREPIEDFCTEALAYLLKTSQRFRRRFVGEILNLDKIIDAEHLKVNTQSFSASEDEDDERNSRIDLLLNLDGKPIIGIEVKVNASPQPNQFTRYQKRYGTAKLFLLAKRSYRKEFRDDAEKHGFTIIYWEAVHELLVIYGLSKIDSNTELAHQFSEFLATLGMKDMNMIQNPKAISNLAGAVKLIDEWNAFLKEKLRPELFPNERAKAPSWASPNHDWPKSSFFGIDSSPYVGFEVDDDGSTWCYYEDSSDWSPDEPLEFGGDWSKQSVEGYITKFSKPLGSKIWMSVRIKYPQMSKNLADDLIVIFRFFRKFNG